MSIFLNNSEISSIKLGDTSVSKICLGNEQVFPAPSPTPTPTPTLEVCPNSTSSVKMTGWVSGDRILSPIGYAPYGRETYLYGDEVVRYETGVWRYINSTYGELAIAYSYAEWPWLVDWPSPYAGEKVRQDGTGCGSPVSTPTPTPTPSPTPTTDYTYTTSNSSITITGYTGVGGAITIPSTIGGLPVVEIGGSAFLNRTSLTSVSIPSSVTSIGGSAFSGCSGLSSVSIPSSVTSIGGYAFYNCSLTSLTIPSSVTSIGEGAFAGCSGLTSISIPSSVISIGDSAFANCSGLTGVTISNGVTSIGSGAFSGCVDLTSVSIPSSITSIGTYAFYGCTVLTSVSIPSSVTSIGSNAFQGSGLTTVTIANGQLGIVSPATDVPFFGAVVTTTLPAFGSSGFQWMTMNSITESTASGIGQNNITVDITQTGGGMFTLNGMHAAYLFPPEYGVPTSGNQIANIQAGVFTAVFSSPVTDALVAFASVGQAGGAVPVLVLDENGNPKPFTVIWDSTSTVPNTQTTYQNPVGAGPEFQYTQFIGEEGFNIIRIDGTMSSVTFNYTVSENYCTVCFGFVDQNV